MAQSRFDLILHPVRLQIMHIVEHAGKISQQELEHRLPELPREMLSRHLDLLIEGGVIVVSARPGQEGMGPVYHLVKAHANITETEVRLATPADHLRYLTTFAAGMIDMYARYLKQPDIDLVADGFELRQELLYLSADELRELVGEFQARLDELVHNQPETGRTPRVFSWVIMPQVLPGDGDPAPPGRD